MKPTYVIAEAGVNHNGSPETALALVAVAAGAGANAVKFQTFRAAALATSRAPQATYQRANWRGENSQVAMLRALELDAATHHRIAECCAGHALDFLSTPFDLKSADFLISELHLPRLKIASSSLTHAPLLHQIARTGTPVILSTGMSSPDEIERALGVLAFGYLPTEEPPRASAFRRAYLSTEGKNILATKVVLLHCTSQYPAPFEEIHLRALETLRREFGLPVGFSDHTPGIAVSLAAVALGAEIIEKHFTLDRSLAGPDHRASLEPSELAALVAGVRQVEKSLGTSRKFRQPSEREIAEVTRCSLVATRTIRAGEPFDQDNLGVKRPGGGPDPIRYWELLGKPARRPYEADEAIEWP